MENPEEWNLDNFTAEEAGEILRRRREKELEALERRAQAGDEDARLELTRMDYPDTLSDQAEEDRSY